MASKHEFRSPNGDGPQDFVIHESTGSGNIDGFLSTGNGFRASPWQVDTGMVGIGFIHYYGGTLAGDLNGDGRTELILATYYVDGRTVKIVSSEFNCGVEGFTIDHDPPVGGYALDTGDFDGDGRSDLLSTFGSRGEVASCMGLVHTRTCWRGCATATTARRG